MLKNNGKVPNGTQNGEGAAIQPRLSPQFVDLFAATISARFTPIFAPINVDIDFDIDIDYIHSPAMPSSCSMHDGGADAGGGGPVCSWLPGGLPCQCVCSARFQLAIGDCPSLHPSASLNVPGNHFQWRAI